jgi:thiol-disulfide isomerase/thioredoxin
LWVLLLCFTAIVGCNDPVAPVLAKATKIKAGEIGSRLPDFSATDLLGHKISSVDLRDKVVLIDIWATWCGPCKKEMPGYQTLADKYGPKGFAVIGLKANMMADTESPLTFAKKIGVHYPLVVATDDLLQKFGGLKGLPTTLLYDRQGIMRKKVIGFEYTSVFDAAVKSLL